MGQKMSDIFFQYQDFSKSWYPGFFQNPFFARLQIGLFFTFCLFFPVPGFFKKSSYRKIPVLEKVKNLFFPRGSNGLHIFGSGECLGSRKKHVFCPSL